MKSKQFCLIFASLWLLISSFTVFAQLEEPKFDFYTRPPYRENVPRPQSILRYDVGDFHTTYSQMERVIEGIAKAAPDRVRVFDIGTTNEYRMQHLVAISSPENIARLDQIKANIARLADPRGLAPAEANQIAANTPVIVWLAYTIHGNESASFETMMQVAYHLAASEEPATQEMLKNSVALILTGENPDGHERFATWYNSVGIGNADRNAIEHREPWSVWGRYNRYRFDLNRDNIAATQKETKNMQTAFFEWNPQILVDHHGQTSQYHFPPAALPINPNLPQPQTNKWLDAFGRANAAQFDQRQWDFYVRDIFDLFYPGYWDSFPSLAGATGMTYETDGGGFKGFRWTRDDGTIATLRGAIAKHYVASLTTLATAATNRESRLRDFYEFKRTGMEEGRTDPMRYIVIDGSRDYNKTREIAEILHRAKIEVRRAGGSFQAARVRGYDDRTAAAQNRNFPAGSLIIDLAQPNKRLAKALLEPDTPQDRAFVNAQMEKYRRNEFRGKSQPKEEYGFYDVTAWNLPMAFGVDAYFTADAPNISNSVLVTEESLRQPRADLPSTRRAQIAYIVPYEQDDAAAFAYRLLKEGFRVSVSTRPLNALNTNFPRGSFVVRVTRNTEAVHGRVAALARELDLKVYATDTGFQETGDTGVGSENVLPLKLPKIAILADEGVDQTSYGSIWWMLDRNKIEHTPMTAGALRRGALNDYNVLILPDGSSSTYSGILNNLKDWINRGGTVIAVKGAAVAAALKDVNLTSARLVGSDEDTEPPAQADLNESKRDNAEAAPSPSPSPTPRNRRNNASPEPTPNPTPTTEKSDKQDFAAPTLPPIASPSANAGKLPEGVPGAIMRGTIDRTSWLTYGVEQDNLPVLLASGYFFRLSKEGTNAVVFEREPKRALTLSGFVWEGNTERLLKGTAYIIDEPVGRGHVILFAEEPFFRGIFRSTSRIFFNSLLLPSAM
ncbi:MAG TPA: M14 family zinc carboxypeptidase [Pyrinomonadaceae bacterium]|nr:M14 family zinc carboxypeptidase [Pyrinomonadaceae bacterium]